MFMLFGASTVSGMFSISFSVYVFGLSSFFVGIVGRFSRWRGMVVLFLSSFVFSWLCLWHVELSSSLLNGVSVFVW